MSVYADYVELQGRRFARRVAAISEGVAMAVKSNEELRMNLDPSYRTQPPRVWLVWVGDAVHGVYADQDKAELVRVALLEEFEFVRVESRLVK